MKCFILVIFICSSIFAQKITLVHGLGNDGSLFNGTQVEQTVNSELNQPLIFKPSLGGNSSANNQSSNLESTLVGNNVDGGLAVSYSMGGIVTRNYMMNEYTSGYNRLNGHISIGTPHLGAKLATNGSVVSELVLYELRALVYPGSIDFINHSVYGSWGIAVDLVNIILGQFIGELVFNYASNSAIQDLKQLLKLKAILIVLQTMKQVYLKEVYIVEKTNQFFIICLHMVLVLQREL